MDNLTASQRSHTMRQVRATDTTPEMAVRGMIHRMGYRFRLHRACLPGKPDLAFPARRKAIFVHGCFWHGHRCSSGANRPASNKSYWTAKLDGNKRRDRRNLGGLRALGWKALVVWECQVKREEWLRRRVVEFLENA